LRLLGPSTLTKLLERAVVGDGGGSLVLGSSQNKRKSMEGRGEIAAALGRELGLGLQGRVPGDYKEKSTAHRADQEMIKRRRRGSYRGDDSKQEETNKSSLLERYVGCRGCDGPGRRLQRPFRSSRVKELERKE
jgi:hypothetical protein